MMCKFFMKELDNIVEDKHNEAEIKKGLETLCSYLPGKYKDKCVAFVDTYTDMIIDLIAQDLSPEEVRSVYNVLQKANRMIVMKGQNLACKMLFRFKICAELGLCMEEFLTMIEDNAEILDGENLDSQACEFCKLAIREIDSMLEDKNNEAEVKAALEQLCGYLPSNYADQCKTLVETYTDIIIDMITKDATPEEVVIFT